MGRHAGISKDIKRENYLKKILNQAQKIVGGAERARLQRVSMCLSAVSDEIVTISILGKIDPQRLAKNTEGKLRR